MIFENYWQDRPREAAVAASPGENPR